VAMKTQLPKPPRYYLGFLRFENGQEMRFPDAIMYPMSEYQMRVIIRDPVEPLEGELIVKNKVMSYPLSHIQYAIAMLDKGEEYRIEIFNHPFETPTYFKYDKSIKGHVIEPEDGDLLKLYDSKDVMKTDSPYQVIQFIS
jgi:hypothetical protein